MGAEVPAVIGVALAFVLMVVVTLRRQSGGIQEFSAEIGDEVLIGSYSIRNGIICVVSEYGVRSALIDGRDPLRLAELLLAESKAEASAR